MKYEREKLNKEIVFLRPNGQIATNAIVSRVNNKNNEVIFMEILDIGREVVSGSKLMLNGKEVYQRIFVQRVYSHVAKQ